MVYKKDIIQELSSIPEIDKEWFRPFLDKISDDHHNLILFKNMEKGNYVFYCTRCKTWKVVPKKILGNLKRGERITCTNCNKNLELKYLSNRFNTFFKYFISLMLNKRKELVVRVFYYEKTFDKHKMKFDERFYEVERIDVERKVMMKKYSYRVMGAYYINHCDYSYVSKDWSVDRSNWWSSYPYTLVYETKEQIDSMVKNSKYKYSCLGSAAENEIDILNYIAVWTDYPKIELIMKSGKFRFIKEICNSYCYQWKLIIENLSKNEFKLIKEHDPSFKEVETALKLKLYDYELLKKVIEVEYYRSKYTKEDLKIIDYLVEKYYNYHDYSNYLEWCERLGMNLNDKKIKFPMDPRKAHDDAMNKIEELINKEYDKEIYRYAVDMTKYIYSNKEYVIRPVYSQNELINESKELHHCVRTYNKKMAQRKCCIFVIRTKNEEDKPFVTLELIHNEIIQVRAKNNDRPEEEVMKFVYDWADKNKLDRSNV